MGLGNIWKFPYIAGENGGGAFVLIYLACIALVGVPIMMAEVLVGRAGRASPIVHAEIVRAGIRLEELETCWLAWRYRWVFNPVLLMLLSRGGPSTTSGFRALGRSLALVLKEQKLYLTIFSVVLGSFCFGTRYLWFYDFDRRSWDRKRT